MNRLILTNLNKFDIKQINIVLLGPWCLRDLKEKEKYWDQIIFQPVFDNAAEIDEASNYILALSEHLIEDYSSRLNQLHQRRYSNQYWSILLMPWIIRSLELFFVRYLHLKRYSNNEFRVSIFKDKAAPVFGQSREFYNYLLTSHGNHLSYTLLIDHLKPKNLTINHDLENERVPITEDRKKINSPKNPQVILRKIQQAIRLLISKLTGVYIEGIKGINLLDHLAIGIKSNFFKKTKMQLPIDNSVQNNNEILSEFQSQHIEFENFIHESLFKLIPTNFTDHFAFNESKANNRIKSLNLRNKTLITTGMGGIDEHRFLLGGFKEIGGKLAFSQHGGWSYGMRKSFPTMAAIEYKCADYFLSWGWTSHADYKVNAVPLPSPLLSKKTKSKKVDKNIIFVGSQIRLTNDRIHSIIQTEQCQEYRREKTQFIDSLNDENLKNLLYRPYFSEVDSFPERNFLHSHFPKLNFLETNFDRKLMGAKCVVVDAPGTTINITLSADIPTILFWNTNYWTMEPDLEEICTKFMELKILHPNGKSAAKFLNSISGNIRSWWHSKEVVQIIDEYQAKYSMQSKNWKDAWIEFVVASDHSNIASTRMIK